MPRRKKTEKNKLEELNQTHAKNETNNPTTLDQVWGDEGLGKYKTLNRDKYKNIQYLLHTSILLFIQIL